MAQEASSALAVVFLVDRFLYWTDESSRLLKMTKLLHRRYPDSPLAPQLVIRQARVYLNSGKLQKAEYILSSLINNCGATGCWIYQSDGDRALVQAVSVQVRGMILQKLGLWRESAELIWASLVGYYSLPQPDKKGIGTSLGILANILVSMNDEDFHAFRTNPDIDFASLFGGVRNRLLSAAQAAKMAVVYSQYTSLYVLTNVTTQGTCLLSYSFSLECPASQRKFYLQRAREAFATGLLTKSEGDLVTSQQELHTFLKAAYSITVAHKWLGDPRQVVKKAGQDCQEALANFYDYCRAGAQDKDGLCAEIMRLVARVKLLWGVDPFPNSEKGSFIPDSYRSVKDPSVRFTLQGFSKIMQRFQKYHASLCETTTKHCKGHKEDTDGGKLCLTALGTTFGTLNTECGDEGGEPLKHLRQTSDMCTTMGSTDNLGSSWQELPISSGSPPPRGSGYAGSCAVGHQADVTSQSCISTEGDDNRSDSMSQSADENKNQNPRDHNSGFGSHAAPTSPTSNRPSLKAGSGSDAPQAGIETLDTEGSWVDGASARKQSEAEAGVDSLSQLALRSSSSSLGDSFGSQSSWEKISADPSSPVHTKPRPNNLAKAEPCQSMGSPGSDGSFYSESSGSAVDVAYENRASRWKARPSHRPLPLESLVHTDVETEVDPAPVKLANPNPPAAPRHLSPAATETSTGSSFEVLEVKQNGTQHNEMTCTEEGGAPPGGNPLCYSCINHCKLTAVAPGRQFLLREQDYQALLAGVCHECLLRRLQSDEMQFKLDKLRTACSALHLKFSKATGLWTARETCVYIGDEMGMKGKQRMAIWVQFLHQEERLSSYVGKDYLKPKEIQFHLKDVERQMTAQYYVTEFNKSLYDKEAMAQIFFIPSEALLILNGDEVAGCVTVEPYMLGDFVKLTNNTGKKEDKFQATKYGLAFGHFTYLLSGGQEVVVDLQGWVTANGKGLTYLTDPQIHSTRAPRGPSNFADRGLRYFLEEQHGPECNEVCELLKLPPLAARQHIGRQIS
ncbi:alpha-protein kinase 1 isoform X2 [Cololabis saira]|nr:alpha-protein kinase 1 isoform X2 [Cololabis saira]